MFENVTYEDILQRMLDRVPSNMDKREGAIIFDALAPAAVELQIMYIELDVILKETFGDTASREYLIRRAAERGIIPLPATYAILKGEFNMNVPIGARFSGSDLNYVVIEQIADGEFQLRCETIGREGNRYFGDLIPIDFIQGLESARLTELLIPGEDEEDTELFRHRYFDSFDAKAFGGNVADYLQKTNSIPGVGATKVTPVWNGGGTVKLTILDSEFNQATPTLIESVQESIDPTRDESGIGIAPIGHVVTVETVEEIEVNILTSILFEEGYSFNAKRQEIIDVIEDYLLGIRKTWASYDHSVVRIAQIETNIMGLDGVIDITGTRINGTSSNLILSKHQIPVLGVVLNE